MKDNNQEISVNLWSVSLYISDGHVFFDEGNNFGGANGRGPQKMCYMMNADSCAISVMSQDSSRHTVSCKIGNLLCLPSVELLCPNLFHQLCVLYSAC